MKVNWVQRGLWHIEDWEKDDSASVGTEEWLICVLPPHRPLPSIVNRSMLNNRIAAEAGIASPVRSDIAAQKRELAVSSSSMNAAHDIDSAKLDSRNAARKSEMAALSREVALLGDRCHRRSASLT